MNLRGGAIEQRRAELPLPDRFERRGFELGLGRDDVSDFLDAAVEAYDRASGKTTPLLHWYALWGGWKRDFSRVDLDLVAARGSVPMISWEPWAGRPNDPTWSLKEAVLIEGEAAQTNTNRWEDYSQTAVDPSDDCTIWYVGDYYKKDATNYSTRIGAFRMPGCK